jgi:hypothetical protein
VGPNPGWVKPNSIKLVKHDDDDIHFVLDQHDDDIPFVLVQHDDDIPFVLDQHDY